MIGIDVGRDSVKVITADRQFSFRSRVGEWRQLNLSAGGKYEVEIDGRKYFISDLVDESYFPREMATESKIHEETKVLFLAAVAMCDDTYITTGLPVIQHKPVDKEALTNLLSGKFRVKVNGQEKIVYIASLGIVPEGGGAYWDYAFDHREVFEKKVRVIDVGSRTVNFCTVDRKRYLEKDSGTLNYGCIELELGGNDWASFARRIAADLSKHWMNYCEDDVILLTGGGSIKLPMNEHFPNCIFIQNPAFSNARGYYKMGLSRCGK